MQNENPGYHINVITKGVYGQFSKVAEEIQEIQDALDQNCTIMVLVEMSDMMGAMEAYYGEKFTKALASAREYDPMIVTSHSTLAGLEADFALLNSAPDSEAALRQVLMSIKLYLMPVNLSFEDLQTMNHITKRAFINGRRVSN